MGGDSPKEIVWVGCYCKCDSQETNQSNCKPRDRRRSSLSHCKPNTQWTQGFHHNSKPTGPLTHQASCRRALALVHLTWPRAPRPRDLLGSKPCWTYWWASTRSSTPRPSQGRSMSLVSCNGVSVFFLFLGVCMFSFVYQFLLLLLD